MVKEGIVLGYCISEKGIEVDRSKVNVIEGLPPFISVKRCEEFSWACGFLPEVYQGIFINCTSSMPVTLERV